MIEASKIIRVGRALARSKWKKILFFVDGHKESLDTKKIYKAFGIAVILIVTTQLLCDSEVKTGTGPSLIGTPSNLTPNTWYDIALARVSELRGGDKESKHGGGAPLKLSPPQLVVRPKNLSRIPPGAMMNAKLISGASNGLVRVEVVEALQLNGETLIESGATLVGDGASSEDRLFVHFSQVVFRDGTFGKIDAQACDASDKIVGLKGSKLGNKALNIAGSIGLGFVGGFTEAFQDSHGEQGAAIHTPSLKNALLNGTATTALEQSQNLMSDLKNRTPVIEVASGVLLCVIFGHQ